MYLLGNHLVAVTYPLGNQSIVANQLLSSSRLVTTRLLPRIRLASTRVLSRDRITCVCSCCFCRLLEPMVFLFFTFVFAIPPLQGENNLPGRLRRKAALQADDDHQMAAPAQSWRPPHLAGAATEPVHPAQDRGRASGRSPASHARLDQHDPLQPPHERHVFTARLARSGRYVRHRHLLGVAVSACRFSAADGARDVEDDLHATRSSETAHVSARASDEFLRALRAVGEFDGPQRVPADPAVRSAHSVRAICGEEQSDQHEAIRHRLCLQRQEDHGHASQGIVRVRFRHHHQLQGQSCARRGGAFICDGNYPGIPIPCRARLLHSRESRGHDECVFDVLRRSGKPRGRVFCQTSRRQGGQARLPTLKRAP